MRSSTILNAAESGFENKLQNGGIGRRNDFSVLHPFWCSAKITD